MPTLLKPDDNSNIGGKHILQVSTQSLPNKIPFQVNKIDDINIIGSLTNVKGDGNCYFISLWYAMGHSDGDTVKCDVTRHRKSIHLHSSDNWKSIVSKVFNGASGDEDPYYFGLSNHKMKLEYISDTNTENVKDKTIVSIVKDFYDWYEKRCCLDYWTTMIQTVITMLKELNKVSGEIIGTILLYYHYTTKKQYACIYQVNKIIVEHRFSCTTKLKIQPRIGIMMVLSLHQKKIAF